MVNCDWNKSHSYKTIISRLLANFFFLHIKKKGEIEYFSISARFGLCHLINLHVYTPCDPNTRICPHKNRSICLTSQCLVSKKRNWNQLLQLCRLSQSTVWLHYSLSSSVTNKFLDSFSSICPRIYSKIIQCTNSKSLLRRLQRRLVSDFFFFFCFLCSLLDLLYLFILESKINMSIDVKCFTFVGLIDHWFLCLILLEFTVLICCP